MPPEEWLGGAAAGAAELPPCDGGWLDYYDIPGHTTWQCETSGELGVVIPDTGGAVTAVITARKRDVDALVARMSECTKVTTEKASTFECPAFFAVSPAGSDTLLVVPSKADAESLFRNMSEAPRFDRRLVLGEFAYVIKEPVKRTKVGSSYTSHRASDGAVFVVVDYTIENLGQATTVGRTSDFRLVDHMRREFTPSSDATMALLLEGGGDMLISQLQPNIPKAQKTAFEVPLTALDGPLTLVVPEKGLLSTGRAELRFRIRP